MASLDIYCNQDLDGNGVIGYDEVCRYVPLSVFKLICCTQFEPLWLYMKVRTS
jgi:hypothetical protein